MKKTLLALLGFILLSTPLAATAQQFGDFTYASDGSAITITGYTGPGGAVTIPANINGLPVTAIGSQAFYNKYSLTNVTIPSSVTSIGDYAFSETGLTSVTMGSGLITIGQQAFAFCSSLTSVTIPDSVTNVGDSAFYFCTSLTNLIVGNGVTSIGYSAFFGCHGLANVTIPAGVTNLGPGAFGGCYAMTAITLDAANSFYSTANGVVFNKNQTTLIEFPAGLGGSYTIPASVTNIGDEAFDYCTSLTNVTIRNGVARIGSGAFVFCTGLTSIAIPASITSLGDYRAFYGCTNLTRVTVSAGVTNITFETFYNCTSLRAAYFLGNAPSDGANVFKAGVGYDPVIVYYLPGTTGWGATFADRPAVLWNPLMQTSGPGFGVGPAGFGFNVTGTADIPIVIEAAASLANPAWVPLQSLNLTNGAFYFSDPNWTNYPARIYRIRSP